MYSISYRRQQCLIFEGKIVFKVNRTAFLNQHDTNTATFDRKDTFLNVARKQDMPMQVGTYYQMIHDKINLSIVMPKTMQIAIRLYNHAINLYTLLIQRRLLISYESQKGKVSGQHSFLNFEDMCRLLFNYVLTLFPYVQVILVKKFLYLLPHSSHLHFKIFKTILSQFLGSSGMCFHSLRSLE